MRKIEKIEAYRKFTTIFYDAPFNLNFKLNYFDEITLTIKNCLEC